MCPKCSRIRFSKMIENLESKITFEIPTDLDFNKLIRGQNYSMFWQNLHHHQQEAAARATMMGSLGATAGDSVFGGDYNASDFSLLNSLQNFASRGGGPATGLTADGSEQLLDPTYERFIGDVWVGIVLTLMILSSIFCMCSCFLYHKFRQWQRSVLTARSQTLSTMDVETPPPYDVESLPSYTIVSGLPSYNDAIEQLKQKQQQKYAGYEPIKVHRPSVIKLFESQSQDLLGGAKLEEIRYNFVSNRSTSAAEGSSESTVAPTTSSNTNATMVTVPIYKNQISTIASDGENPASLKKFNVSRYTLESERSSNALGS